MKNKILVGLYIEIKKAIQRSIDECAGKVEKQQLNAKLFEEKTNAEYDAILAKQMAYTTKVIENIAAIQKEEEELKKLL